MVAKPPTRLGGLGMLCGRAVALTVVIGQLNVKNGFGGDWRTFPQALRNQGRLGSGGVPFACEQQLPGLS